MPILLTLIGSVVLAYVGATFLYVAIKLFQDRHELAARMASRNLAYNPGWSFAHIGMCAALGFVLLAISVMFWFSPLLATLLTFALIAFLAVRWISGKSKQLF